MENLPAGNRSELKAAAICGLVIAIAINLGWLLTLFSAMQSNTWRWPIAFVTCLIQTVMSTAGAVGFAWLYARLKVNVWFTVIYGAMVGALVSALSPGLSIGVRVLLGTKVAMIVSVREAAYLNTASRLSLFGCGGGFAFGMVGFFIPRIIGVLALSLSRRLRARRRASA